jgi:phosphotransferase system HPr-like phosphotransfer protein
MPGTQITITAEGIDAEEAVKRLREMIERED